MRRNKRLNPRNKSSISSDIRCDYKNVDIECNSMYRIKYNTCQLLEYTTISYYIKIDKITKLILFIAGRCQSVCYVVYSMLLLHGIL